jgi:fructose-1,6-bisphosphatase
VVWCCRQAYAQVENLDMKEINFNQSKKDLTEAKIHHLLSESMAKQAKRTKKLTYRYTNSLAEARIHHLLYRGHT